MLKIKFSIFPLVCLVVFLVESYVMLQEPKGWVHQAAAEAPWRGVCFGKLLSPVLCSARGALSPRLYHGPRGEAGATSRPRGSADAGRQATRTDSGTRL